MDKRELTAWSVQRAVDALRSGEPQAAWQWLQAVPDHQRPPDLAASCVDVLSRAEANAGRWGAAEDHAAQAVRLQTTPARQERLMLLRKRVPLLGDREFELIAAKVPPPARLSSHRLRPEVQQLHACGAYYAWGRRAEAPWSRYLRLSKTPDEDKAERVAIFRLAAGYFCRYLLQHANVVATAELVVPVPANPDRYVNRMASLPDELAKGVQAMLAIPLELDTLRWRPDKAHIEVKKLHRTERRQASQDSFAVGRHADRVQGRVVLLVDDITTTGGTLTACASMLHKAGATHVLAACLAHTEG